METHEPQRHSKGVLVKMRAFGWKLLLLAADHAGWPQSSLALSGKFAAAPLLSTEACAAPFDAASFVGPAESAQCRQTCAYMLCIRPASTGQRVGLHAKTFRFQA